MVEGFLKEVTLVYGLCIRYENTFKPFQMTCLSNTSYEGEKGEVVYGQGKFVETVKNFNDICNMFTMDEALAAQLFSVCKLQPMGQICLLPVLSGLKANNGFCYLNAGCMEDGRKHLKNNIS